MGSKRPADTEAGNATKKRRDHGKTSTTAIDPTYGQRGAFGNLQDLTTAPTGDSDLDCEDDAEALAYLRSVRVQASAIPHVLAAKTARSRRTPQTGLQPSDALGDQKEIKEEDEDEGTAEVEDEEDIDRSLYQDGRGDFRGYYHDGAYTAYPAGYFDQDYEEEEYEDECEEENVKLEEDGAEPDLDDEESSQESSEGGPHNSSADEIRDAYFASLTAQYMALRKILHTPPPDSLLDALPKSNPTKVDEFGRESWTFVKWSGRMRGTDPLPAQIAGMHKDGIMRLLIILLNGKFLRKNNELRERTSRWIWALLARLPEQGELDYQEIGRIRELGKRAVLLMVSRAELEVLEEHYDVGAVSNENHHEDEGEVDDDGFDSDMLQDDDHDDDNDEYSEAQGQAFDDTQDSQRGEVDAPPSIGEDAPIINNTGADGVTADSVELDGHESVGSPPNATKGRETAGDKAPEAAATTGESSDIEMQIDSDVEDGEVSEPPQQTEPAADIETAKARLLAQLDGARAEEEEDKGETQQHAPPEQSTSAPKYAPADEEEQEKARRQKIQQAKINERATLNMILTVVGEFYGQRDLLEFRDPFGGLQLEENE
ncbi:hypothetical protein F4779DRAFT_637176 [Xylariaceae sp. FL0662B]|nr:hypothetical protein F4779DRAFT_637176 [Xylariaceae sp. FL0662B]